MLIVFVAYIWIAVYFYCWESIVKKSALDLPYYVDFVIECTGYRAGGRKQTRTAYIPQILYRGGYDRMYWSAAYAVHGLAG